jgi:hypothetical protein
MTQITQAPARTRAQVPDKTLRRDPWWRAAALTAALLTIWVAYAPVHVFIGRWYWVPRYHYLTPFYSLCVSGECVPGSGLTHFSGHPFRYRVWTRISWLNARHMQLAWITLGTLMLTDLYIWLVASGSISDLRFFN